MNLIKLVFLIAANSRSYRMNREMIGYAVEDKYVLSSSEAESFSRATGDSRMQKEGFVPPFIFARIFCEPIKKILFCPQLKINLLRMVHGNISVKWHHPIVSGTKLRTVVTVEDIVNTSAGEILSLSGKIFEGETLVVEVISGFPVRGKRQGQPREKLGEGERKIISTIELGTEKNQSVEYAYASGDMNPIHRRVLFARLAGFPRPIMQGMCVMAMCENHLVNKLTSGTNLSTNLMSGRFSYTVFPGERLVIEVYAPYGTGFEKEYQFAVFNERGREVIKNGRIVFG
ncbi:MAG TPA: MaoC/PaaZ C-terminal domain-containing protein [Spirochaetota bacterium]